MLNEILIAGGLVVLTATIHVVGFSVLIRSLIRSRILTKSGFRLATLLLIGVTCWLVLIHVAEISIWGLSYYSLGCFPDAESSFYFSAGAYTTENFGDLNLPERWRLLAPLQALTANLMFGLSTGLFFAIVSLWISNWTHRLNAAEPQSGAPAEK
jgi:hypothetical protein